MDNKILKKNYTKSKNIILFANCPWYLFNFRKDLLELLNKRGYRLILISSKDRYYKKISKYFIKYEKLFFYRGSENLIFEGFTLINILYLYLKYKPEIIHHFTIKPSIYGGIIGRMLGIKNIINHITGLGPSFFSNRKKIRIFNIIFTPLYIYAFNNYRSINIFHNSNDRDTFIKKKFSNIKNNIVIKGSGVDTDYFKPSFNKETFNKEINILFPARIIKEKGIIELISACEDLWKENYKFSLNIAGDIDTSNQSSLIEKNLEIFNENKNINLIGKSDDMRNVYKKIDMVVLPSWREGLSKSLLEASSMALPIITTDVPGCNDVIKNNYSGILVPPKDKESLKLAIKKYMDNPSLALIYGAKAREVVLNNFTTKEINDQILKIYDQFSKKTND